MIRLAAALLAVVAVPALAVAPAAKPRTSATRNWADVAAFTADGGVRLGNPNAPVKLVEYGSMTCPHCQAFEQEGAPTLVGKYVKGGRVSWEFRNYVRDSFDIAASLIARCNGAGRFFPLTRALFVDQRAWLGRGMAAPQARIEAAANLPTDRQFLEIARIAGLQQWAAARGVPMAKSAQCLTNAGGVEQLVRTTGIASDRYPDFPGTPTFILNGVMLDRTASWDALEPQLRRALGERR